MFIETRFEYEMAERLVRATEKIAKELERKDTDKVKAAVDKIISCYGESPEDSSYGYDFMIKTICEELNIK